MSDPASGSGPASSPTPPLLVDEPEVLVPPLLPVPLPPVEEPVELVGFPLLLPLPVLLLVSPLLDVLPVPLDVPEPLLAPNPSVDCVSVALLHAKPPKRRAPRPQMAQVFGSNILVFIRLLRDPAEPHQARAMPL